MGEDALADIEKASTKDSTKKEPSLEIILNFISKTLFSYLPLVVYCIVNIPYYKLPKYDDNVEQLFLKNIFLALSYVFISQVNSLSFKQDAIGNFLYGIKIFFGICCIAFFATDKFHLTYWWFNFFFIISLCTLFFSVKQSVNQS